eukprot:Filipodium_phascolosomae@DN1408_c0_g1_i2.p1
MSVIERKRRLGWSGDFSSMLLLLAMCSTYFLDAMLLVMASVWPLISHHWHTLLFSVIVFTSLALPPLPLSRFRCSSFMQRLGKYFDLEYVFDTEGGYGALSKWPKRFIVAMGPHGVVPVTAWAVGSDPSAILYGPTAVANVLLRMPLIHGIVCGLYKVIPSTRKSIMKVLSSGQNVMLYPGGIAEIFVNSPTKEKLYWRNRKGIVRVAMVWSKRAVEYLHAGGRCRHTAAVFFGSNVHVHLDRHRQSRRSDIPLLGSVARGLLRQMGTAHPQTGEGSLPRRQPIRASARSQAQPRTGGRVPPETATTRTRSVRSTPLDKRKLHS